MHSFKLVGVFDMYWYRDVWINNWNFSKTIASEIFHGKNKGRAAYFPRNGKKFKYKIKKELNFSFF